MQVRVKFQCINNAPKIDKLGKHGKAKKTDVLFEPQDTELLRHFFITLISTLLCAKDNTKYLSLQQGSLCTR